MANRILRDWTDSERVDQLSFEAEVLFVRLFMKADDFGYFHANIKLVKAALFPLKDISESWIIERMQECELAGLIEFYDAEGKKYLKINNFKQRLRKMVSKFPQPDSKARTIDSKAPPETNTNTNPETKLLTQIDIEKEILSSNRWIQDTALFLSRIHKCKVDIEWVNSQLRDFLAEQKLKNEPSGSLEGRSIKDLRDHFINVCKKIDFTKITATNKIKW